jgi:hypothetical protein
MTFTFETVRNTHKTPIFEGSMGADFISTVGDFREMSIGFIQAIYDGVDAFDGSFEIFVGIENDESTFARLPNSALVMDADCNSICWNLCCIGYRFFYVKYTANSVTTGTVKLLARGKKP